MTFRPAETDNFSNIFKNSKDKIRNFPGCHYLSLLRNHQDPRIFFTYSIWEDQEALNNYRKSELFGITWKATKALFEEAPEAWSVDRIQELP